MRGLTGKLYGLRPHAVENELVVHSAAKPQHAGNTTFEPSEKPGLDQAGYALLRTLDADCSLACAST